MQPPKEYTVFGLDGSIKKVKREDVKTPSSLRQSVFSLNNMPPSPENPRRTRAKDFLEKQIPKYADKEYISGKPFREAVNISESGFEFECLVRDIILIGKEKGYDVDSLTRTAHYFINNYEMLKKEAEEAGAPEIHFIEQEPGEVSRDGVEEMDEPEEDSDDNGVEGMRPLWDGASILVGYNGNTVRLATGQYSISFTDGVSETFTNKKGEQVEIQRCYHPIFPIELLTNIETGRESVRVAYFRDGEWKHIVRMKSDLYKPAVFRSYVDYGISIEPNQASQMITFLQRMENWNRENIPKGKTCSHLGWVESDDIAFLPYSHDILYEKAREFPKEYASLRANGSFQKWRDAISRYRDEEHKLARIILATAFASVLVRPMGCLPFIVHVWSGESSIGKTVALMMCASVWANPGMMNGYIKSFNGTEESLQRMASFLCDMPLLIDERQAAGSGTDFEHLIYTLCEGITRGRSGHGDGLRPQGKWSNSIITSGEQPLLSVKSRSGAKARVIELSPTKPIFDSDKTVMNGFAETLRNNHAIAGKVFIAKLLGPELPLELGETGRTFEDCESGLDAAKVVFRRYLREINQTVTSKQAMAAALILTADALISTSWIFGDQKRLSIDDIRPYLKEENQISIVRQAYDELMEWIGDHEDQFTEEAKDRYGVVVTHNGRKTYAFIVSKFRTLMDEIGCEPEFFITWGIENDLVAVDNDGTHRTISVNIPGGKTKRCYGIYEIKS